MNEFEAVVEVKDLVKKYKTFTLEIPELKLPKGFATALIGENGAGKSTLINITAGINLSYKGEVKCFGGKYEDTKKREKMGYAGATNYYMPNWTIKQACEANKILYDGFSEEKFWDRCEKLGIHVEKNKEKAKPITKLSDGMQMKVMLSGVFARDTECLLLDEPASPLDPLMRDYLCGMIREYLDNGNGNTSVVFSTHNIADMENVTDYAVIIEQGRVVEQGFVDDLKEKYIVVKGDECDSEKAEPLMFTISKSHYGFEGIALTENIDKFVGMNIVTEQPTLSQIAVAVMKKYSVLKEG